MTTYSFSQLEELWIQAGGSKALAPLMAGVAEVESGGNPQAYNPSGASGLWQIEIPVNARFVPGGAANVFNALDNAKAAVALSGNTMAGIQANWLAFEPSGAAEAIAAKNGGTVPSTGSLPSAGNAAGVATGTTTSPSGTTPAGSTSGGVPDPSAPGGLIGFTESLPLGIGNLFKAIEPLLHAVATVIDYSFAVFQPGQGQRALFALGALILAFLSYRVMAGSGSLPFPKVGAV